MVYVKLTKIDGSGAFQGEVGTQREIGIGYSNDKVKHIYEIYRASSGLCSRTSLEFIDDYLAFS